jgi:signal transduction histidine kinase
VDIVRDPMAPSWPPQLDRVAVVHQSPEQLALGADFAARYPPDWSRDEGLPRVIRERTPLFVPVVTDEMLVAGARDEEHLAYLRRLAFSSIIVVPLAARGMTLGALTLCMSESRRRFDEQDLVLALDLAHRAAVAVDNARLYREAERARSEAEAANRAKSQFLSTMSHELRTPLNAITGYTELLELGVRGPLTEVQSEDLGRIRRSATVLMSLVNDVLNFARVEVGQVDFDLAPVRLDQTLGDLETLIAPQLAAKSLRYEYRPPNGGDSVYVSADADRLKQILTNLLTNAVKFTDDGGLVTVAYDVAPEFARVRVADTGRGIPSDRLDAIFEPFVQVDRHLTRDSQQGVGLGLAISRELARKMGGDITVASAVGEGSTFTLTLPRAKPSEASA